MASDWKTTTFEESSIEILDGDRGKNYPKKSEFTESGYCLFLNTGNVTKDGFKFSSTEFVSSERDQLLRKGKLQREDVVLTTRGTVGNVAYYDSSIPFDHIRINSGMVILRSDDTKILPRYLYLFLRSKLFEDQVIALQSGSAQPQLPIRDIKRVEIKVPSVTEQKTIAHILGSLDEKIELNRQMNETLEAMAQALFKSWFIDFDPVIDSTLAAGNAMPEALQKKAAERAEQRKVPTEKDNLDIQDLFPDKFEFTEDMGWIPKGWAVGTVEDVVKRLKSKKSYNKKDVLEHGEVPVYEQGAKILLGYHNNEPDIEAQINDPAFIFGDHTCINKLSLEPFSISSNVIPLTGKIYPTLWVYYAVKDKQSFEEYRRHWMEFIIKSVILPPLEVTKLFSEYIKSFQVKQMKIQHQNSELAKLRDKLLPKLMSGKLRIADAAKLVDKVL